MKKKSPLKPTGTRSAGTRARKLTPKEALKIGRTTREERREWRRRLQKRRIAQRQRDKKKAALLAKTKRGLGPVLLPEAPLPPGPVPAGMDYGSRIPSDPEVPIRKHEPPQRQPAPAPPRRAVRAERKRGKHGPNRGGESAQAWE